VRSRRCCRRPAVALASHGKPMSLACSASGWALPNAYSLAGPTRDAMITDTFDLHETCVVLTQQNRRRRLPEASETEDPRAPCGLAAGAAVDWIR
jgi:hypothetical protein